MAFQVKFTAQRGKANNPAQVTVAAGTSEAQSDTIGLNADVTNLSKGEFLTMIDDVKARIEKGLWPPI